MVWVSSANHTCANWAVRSDGDDCMMGGKSKSGWFPKILNPQHNHAICRRAQQTATATDLTWVRFCALRTSLPCNNGILGRVRTCLMTLHQP